MANFFEKIPTIGNKALNFFSGGNLTQPVEPTPPPSLSLLQRKVPPTVPIAQIVPTSPVISSEDHAASYREGSTKVDTLLQSQVGQSDVQREAALRDAGLTPEQIAAVKAGKGYATETTTETGTSKTETAPAATSGDLSYDTYNKELADTEAKATAKATADKAEYEAAFKTSLSAIDATTQATIGRLNVLFDKRLKEQERLNRISVDARKAYGLSEGGQYTPIAMTDAMTDIETEAADKISALELERGSLIAEAKAARDTGSSKLMNDKLAKIDDIDTNLRSTLKDVEKKSLDQYTLQRELRKEEEAKIKEKQQKTLKGFAAIASQFTDQYDKMSAEEKDKWIKARMKTDPDLTYADIYDAMQTALKTGKKTVAEEEKAKLDIQKSKIDIEKGQLGLTETKIDIAKKKKELEAGTSDFTDTQKKELEAADLLKAPRQQQLDYLFRRGNETEQADYETKYGKGNEETVAKNAKIGEEVIIGGKKYIKKADDDFVPVE